VITYLLFAGLISVSYTQILLKIILTARKVKKNCDAPCLRYA